MFPCLRLEAFGDADSPFGEPAVSRTLPSRPWLPGIGIRPGYPHPDLWQSLYPPERRRFGAVTRSNLRLEAFGVAVVVHLTDRECHATSAPSGRRLCGAVESEYAEGGGYGLPRNGRPCDVSRVHGGLVLVQGQDPLVSFVRRGQELPQLLGLGESPYGTTDFG